LAQRLPKLGGFKNPFKIDYSLVNLSKLSRFKDGTEVTVALLVEAGLAQADSQVKVLGAGKLGRTGLVVEAHAFSASAQAAIEAKGGSIRVIGEPKPKRGPNRPDKVVEPKDSAGHTPVEAEQPVADVETDGETASAESE
jgi:ribosomal protein L18E